MAVGWLKYLNFRVCWLTARVPRRRWPKRKPWPCVFWLTVLNMAKAVPSPSTFHSLLRDPMASGQGEACLGGFIAHGLASQAAIRLSPHALAIRLAGFHIRLPR